MEISKIKSLTDRIKLLLKTNKDFPEKLKHHLVLESNNVKNPLEFIVELIEGVLIDGCSSDLKAAFGLKETEIIVQLAITIACSKNARFIGVLMNALEGSGNSDLICGLRNWVQEDFGIEAGIILSKPKQGASALPARKRNSPVAVNSCGNQQTSEEPKVVRPPFFQRAALPDELSKVATFKWQEKSVATAVQFDNEKMMACSDDGVLKLWRSRGNEQETANVAVKVKNITCFQYDEEILVLGTAKGMVHLFDARTFEEKWLVRLDGPVISLKFVESALVVLSRSLEQDQIWWMEISRPGMRLLNREPLLPLSGYENRIAGICMYPDVSFVYSRSCQFVRILGTKLGRWISDDDDQLSYLKAPANISTLHVGDLICAKQVVVAGCVDGAIAMWTTSEWKLCQSPVKTFQWHTEGITNLWSLNGHLLSLDQGGQLLMWSGHDLENKYVTPVPRVFEGNFSNVTTLAAHERWFATCCTTDDIINIWTLPDLWLRAG